MTKGYYKMEEKTYVAYGPLCRKGPRKLLLITGSSCRKEDFREEEDGRIWFHTGDVGQWNEDGSLSIIGRTKDIFKLDGGEYIAYVPAFAGALSLRRRYSSDPDLF